MAPSQIVPFTPAETEVPGAIVTFNISVTNPEQEVFEAETVKYTYPKLISSWEGT